MKTQLTQVEIDTAISNHVRSLINVNDDQQITIKLRATRGAGGFTADVSIDPIGTVVESNKAPTKKAQAAADQVKASPAPAPAPVAATEAVAEQPVAAQEPAPEAETVATASEAEPVAAEPTRGKSLFGN